MSSADGSACVSCPVGTTGTNGMCTPCPAGTFSSVTGRRTPCEECPAGTWSVVGAAECHAGPANSSALPRVLQFSWSPPPTSAPPPPYYNMYYYEEWEGYYVDSGYYPFEGGHYYD